MKEIGQHGEQLPAEVLKPDMVFAPGEAVPPQQPVDYMNEYFDANDHMDKVFHRYLYGGCGVFGSLILSAGVVLDKIPLNLGTSFTWGSATAYGISNVIIGRIEHNKVRAYLNE